MRIIRFASESPVGTFGVLVGDTVHALKGDILDHPGIGEPVAPLDEVTLLAPCIPTKVVCVAVNFPGIDGYSESMKEPLVFVKPASSVVGPNATVLNPFPGVPWWGEAELGVVIGRKAQKVEPLSAHEYVLGLTIGNDVTVENCDSRDHHLARSKGADGFCPIGPWIETEIPTEALLIEAVQDGETIRRGLTCDQVWQWPEIISRVSQWMSLNPFDVILTGNAPDIVGMRYLTGPSVFEARVQGIGTLKTFFV